MAKKQQQEEFPPKITTPEVSRVVRYADEECDAKLCALVKRATEVYDLGTCVLSAGDEGGLTYAGRILRLVDPVWGPIHVVVGGWNCRRWNTQNGRGELAYGAPATDAWDAVPTTIIPSPRVLAVFPTTNKLEPRKYKALEQALSARGVPGPWGEIG